MRSISGSHCVGGEDDLVICRNVGREIKFLPGTYPAKSITNLSKLYRDCGMFHLISHHSGRLSPTDGVHLSLTTRDLFTTHGW